MNVHSQRRSCDVAKPQLRLAEVLRRVVELFRNGGRSGLRRGRIDCGRFRGGGERVRGLGLEGEVAGAEARDAVAFD